MAKQTPDGGRIEMVEISDFRPKRAVITYPDGGRYEGEIDGKPWKPHGWGILTEPDGTRHEGSWNNGQFVGDG